MLVVLTIYRLLRLEYGNNMLFTLFTKFFSSDFVIRSLIFSRSLNFSTSVRDKSSRPTLYTRSSNVSNSNNNFSRPLTLWDLPIFIKANAWSTKRLSHSISYARSVYHFCNKSCVSSLFLIK